MESLKKDIEFGRPVVKEGAYGTITFDREFAYKRFDKSDENIFYREVFYLSLFSKLKISQIVDAGNLVIKMKKYDGSIDDLIRKLPQKERINLADQIYKQILPTVKFMHSRGVSHRDITTGNIFYTIVGKRYEFYLADFSLATVFDKEKPWSCGTCMRTDPDKSASIFQTDLWMFGVTLYEFISGRKNVENMQNSIARGDDFFDISIEVPGDLYYFISKCLNYLGKDRPCYPIENPLKGDEHLNDNLILKKLHSVGFKNELLYNLAVICFYNVPVKCVKYPEKFYGKLFISTISEFL